MQSPFSKEMLKNADKVVIIKTAETNKSIYFDMVYIDNEGRHEHTVSLDKSIEVTDQNILDALWCDCTNCSSYEILTKRWCIYKIATAKKLIELGLWKAYILNYIYGDEIEI